jgi:hypothetical protein
MIANSPDSNVKFSVFEEIGHGNTGYKTGRQIGSQGYP